MPIPKKDPEQRPEWEYAATVPYVQHAARISGARVESILNEMILLSRVEMKRPPQDRSTISAVSRR
ncbi:MAG TPA: hypothetical protein PK014_06615 [Thermoanaerobaculia bacterium]|nr:hypothetical protein [Thermoanaerobaculia bacterium]HUM29425.1 hypothetical protein [Thermoanaerobaculia bacterium]HXK67671.1 hypothetical protein [Thermoanaerobaculia bacterium]